MLCVRSLAESCDLTFALSRWHLVSPPLRWVRDRPISYSAHILQDNFTRVLYGVCDLLVHIGCC